MKKKQNLNRLKISVRSVAKSEIDKVVHDNEVVHQANLNGLREGVTSAVAEGREVGEADVVAVHELGQPSSQKQQNLRVCEA